MAELDISANSVQLDCSVDSGICVEGVTKDLKKKIQEFKRILFILERDKEAMRLLRERLSRITERKIVKKKKDGQSVCNVCFSQIDTDDSKTCIACCLCAKNVCRGEKCSEWVPKVGEWRCQLCAARRDSYGKASTWVQEQSAVKRASLTEFSYPMRARSEIYIPLCDPNESAFLCNFESVSEVSSPINPNQKQHIREYIEEVLADMIGGSLQNATVEPISTNNIEYQQVRNGHELQGISNVRLRRLIESIIAETIRQPPFASAGLITTTAIEANGDIDHRETLPLNGNHCNGNGGQYFESKKYQDLLATAVLNKIVNTHGNGRHSESSPDLTSSSILDNNHNTLNLNKTDESISSSSSVEPRSESSLTDPIRSINKDDDLSPIRNYGNFYDDDANDNIEADRESVLSDFISSHMVPLPHISADPASEEDEDEEDFISVTSSRDANWEDNWLFKKKKSNKTSASVGMLVPAPKEDIRALIGDKPTDEVSDLSEVGSDTDDSSLEMVSASLEPLNDRLVNKHLIGGKNTKIVLDEIADRTSMISTSSLPDDVPPYTETKNEFVVSNDGLNESEPLKISVNSCNKAISNEAINSNVTKNITTKAEKLTKESQVTEDESIVPPPNDFTDDEKMRNLLAKFNEEQNIKTDSGDDNSSSLSPRSSISCALSAGIDRGEIDAYEGITDFCVEDEEGLASEIESSSRRPSVIEILAAIALGPMLAVSASDDRNILTELELSSLMELNELAMAQLNAKSNEERRLGVIAEESFESGLGDDCRIETIESNEEADLLSSPKMVMEAIKELVGKGAIRSETSQESSIKIEEITDKSEKSCQDLKECDLQKISNDSEQVKNICAISSQSQKDIDKYDQENTEERNILTEMEKKNIDAMKKSEQQKNQEQFEIKESFDFVSGEEEMKNDVIEKETTAPNEVKPREEIHQEYRIKNESENQGIDESKFLNETQIIETKTIVGLTSKDEDNCLSEDLGFEKIIPEDTSSISDESLHTIGSSDYSEDLEGDAISIFIDEQNISVTAELSDYQKLEQFKEVVPETQPIIQTKLTRESDKTMNEFILPPPSAFSDEQFRTLNEDGENDETVQVKEAHINYETVQVETEITSENSSNEQEIIVTEEQTHNENLFTDINNEKEVKGNTNTFRISETDEMTISNAVLPQCEKSEEPPDKQSMDNILPQSEVVSSFEIVSTTEEPKSKTMQHSKTEADEEKLVEKCFPGEAVKKEDSAELVEQESENIVEEQTASSIINEPAALKILSEAQLTLHELSSRKLSDEELSTVTTIEGSKDALNYPQDVIKSETNPETLKLEGSNLNEAKINASKLEDSTNDALAEENNLKQPGDENSVQSIDEAFNKQNLKTLKDETSEGLNKIPASLKTELKNKEAQIEKSVKNLATESKSEFTTENIGALVDDTVKTELEDNPEIKCIEAHEKIKTEAVEMNKIELEETSETEKVSPENKCSKLSEYVQIEDVKLKELNLELCSDSDSTKEIFNDQLVTIPDNKLVLAVSEILNSPESENITKLADELVKKSANTSQTNELPTEAKLNDLQLKEVHISSVEVSADSVEEKSQLGMPMTENFSDKTIDIDPHKDQTKSIQDAQFEESTLAVSDEIAGSEQVVDHLQTETNSLEDVTTEVCSKELKVNSETNTKSVKDDDQIETISTEHEVEALNNNVIVGENSPPDKLSEDISKQFLEESDTKVITETTQLKMEQETVESSNVTEIKTIPPYNQISTKIEELTSVLSEISQQVKFESHLIPEEDSTKKEEGMEAVVKKVTRTIDPEPKAEEKECEVSEQSSEVTEDKSLTETPIQTESSNLVEPQTADIASVSKTTILLNSENCEFIDSTDKTLTTLTNFDSDKRIVGASVNEGLQSESTSIVLSSIDASNEKHSENTEIQEAEDANQVPQKFINLNETKAPEGSSETIQSEKITEGKTLPNKVTLTSVSENTTLPAEPGGKVDKNSESSKIENVQPERLADLSKKAEEHFESPIMLAESPIVEESISETEEKKCEENSFQTQKASTLDDGLTAEKLDKVLNTPGAHEISGPTEDIKTECSTALNESKIIKQESLIQKDHKHSKNLTETVASASNESQDVEEPFSSSSASNLEEQQPQNNQISDSDILENKTDHDKQVEMEKSEENEVDNAFEIKKSINDENCATQIQEQKSVEASDDDQVTESKEKSKNDTANSILFEKNIETLEQEEQIKITGNTIELSIESSIIKESESNDDPAIHSLEENTSKSKESTELVSKACESNKDTNQENAANLKQEQQNEISETSKLEEEQTKALETKSGTPEVSTEPEDGQVQKSLDDLEIQSNTENKILCKKVIEISTEKASKAPKLNNELLEKATGSISNEKLQSEDSIIEEKVECQVNKDVLPEVKSNTLEDFFSHSKQNLAEKPENQDIGNICAEEVAIELVIDTNSANPQLDAKEQIESSRTVQDIYNKVLSHETKSDKILVEITEKASEEKEFSNENNTCEASKPSEDFIKESNDQNQEAIHQNETSISDSVSNVVDTHLDQISLEETSPTIANNIVVDNSKAKESVVGVVNETINDMDKTSAGNLEVKKTASEQSCNPTKSKIDIEMFTQSISAAAKPHEISKIPICQVEDAKKVKSTVDSTAESSQTDVVTNETIIETQKTRSEFKEENIKSIIENLTMKSRTSEEISEPVTEVQSEVKNSETTDKTTETVKTTEKDTAENIKCGNPENVVLCEIGETEHEIIIMESEQDDKTEKTNHDIRTLISEEISTEEVQGSNIVQQTEHDEIHSAKDEPAANDKKIEILSENQETISEKVSESEIESGTTCVQIHSISTQTLVEEEVNKREEDNAESSPKDKTKLAADETICKEEEESMKEILIEVVAELNSQRPASKEETVCFSSCSEKELKYKILTEIVYDEELNSQEPASKDETILSEETTCTEEEPKQEIPTKVVEDKEKAEEFNSQEPAPKDETILAEETACTEEESKQEIPTEVVEDKEKAEEFHSQERAPNNETILAEETACTEEEPKQEILTEVVEDKEKAEELNSQEPASKDETISAEETACAEEEPKQEIPTEVVEDKEKAEEFNSQEPAPKDETILAEETACTEEESKQEIPTEVVEDKLKAEEFYSQERAPKDETILAEETACTEEEPKQEILTKVVDCKGKAEEFNSIEPASKDETILAEETACTKEEPKQEIPTEVVEDKEKAEEFNSQEPATKDETISAEETTCTEEEPKQEIPTKVVEDKEKAEEFNSQEPAPKDERVLAEETACTEEEPKQEILTEVVEDKGKAEELNSQEPASKDETISAEETSYTEEEPEQEIPTKVVEDKEKAEEFNSQQPAPKDETVLAEEIVCTEEEPKQEIPTKVVEDKEKAEEFNSQEPAPKDETILAGETACTEEEPKQEILTEVVEDKEKAEEFNSQEPAPKVETVLAEETACTEEEPKQDIPTKVVEDKEKAEEFNSQEPAPKDETILAGETACTEEEPKQEIPTEVVEDKEKAEEFNSQEPAPKDEAVLAEETACREEELKQEIPTEVVEAKEKVEEFNSQEPAPKDETILAGETACTEEEPKQEIPTEVVEDKEKAEEFNSQEPAPKDEAVLAEETACTEEELKQEIPTEVVEDKKKAEELNSQEPASKYETILAGETACTEEEPKQEIPTEVVEDKEKAEEFHSQERALKNETILAEETACIEEEPKQEILTEVVEDKEKAEELNSQEPASKYETILAGETACTEEEPKQEIPTEVVEDKEKAEEFNSQEPAPKDETVLAEETACTEEEPKQEIPTKVVEDKEKAEEFNSQEPAPKDETILAGETACTEEEPKQEIPTEVVEDKEKVEEFNSQEPAPKDETILAEATACTEEETKQEILTEVVEDKVKTEEFNSQEPAPKYETILAEETACTKEEPKQELLTEVVNDKEKGEEFYCQESASKGETILDEETASTEEEPKQETLTEVVDSKEKAEELNSQEPAPKDETILAGETACREEEPKQEILTKVVDCKGKAEEFNSIEPASKDETILAEETACTKEEPKQELLTEVVEDKEKSEEFYCQEPASKDKTILAEETACKEEEPKKEIPTEVVEDKEKAEELNSQEPAPKDETILAEDTACTEELPKQEILTEVVEDKVKAEEFNSQEPAPKDEIILAEETDCKEEEPKKEISTEVVEDKEKAEEFNSQEPAPKDEIILAEETACKEEEPKQEILTEVVEDKEKAEELNSQEPAPKDETILAEETAGKEEEPKQEIPTEVVEDKEKAEEFNSQEPASKDETILAEETACKEEEPKQEIRTEVVDCKGKADEFNSQETASNNGAILAEEIVCIEEELKKEKLTEVVDSLFSTIEEINSERPAADPQDQTLAAQLLMQEQLMLDHENVYESEVPNEATKKLTQKSEEREIEDISAETAFEEPIDSKEHLVPIEVMAKLEEINSETTSSIQNTEEVLEKDDSIDKTMQVEEKAEIPKSEDLISEETNVAEGSSKEDILDNLPNSDTENVKDAPIPEPEVQNAELDVKLEAQEAILDCNLKTDDEKIKFILNESDSTLKTDDEKIKEIPVIEHSLTENAIEKRKTEIMPSISSSTDESILDSETTSAPLEDVNIGKKETATNENLDSSETSTTECSNQLTISNESESQKITTNIEDTTVQVNGADSEVVSDDKEILAKITTDSEKVKSNKQVLDEIPNSNVESKIAPILPTENLLKEKSIAENDEISLEKLQSEELSEISSFSNKLAKISKSEEITLDSKPDLLAEPQVKELYESENKSPQQTVEVIKTHASISGSQISSVVEKDFEEEASIKQPIPTKEPKLQEESKIIENILSDETTKVCDEESTKTEEPINEPKAINIQEGVDILLNSSTETFSQEKVLVETESAVSEELESQANYLKEVSITNEPIEDNVVLETTLLNEVKTELKSLKVSSSEDTEISEKQVSTSEISEEPNTQEGSTNIDMLVVAEITDTNEESNFDGTVSGETNVRSFLQEISNHPKNESVVENVVATEEIYLNKSKPLTETNELPISDEVGSDLKETHPESGSVSSEEKINIDVSKLQGSIITREEKEEKPVKTVLATESEDVYILSKNEIDQICLKDTTSSENTQQETKYVEQTAEEAEEVQEQITEVKAEALRTDTVHTKQVASASEVNGASEEVSIQNAVNAVIPSNQLDELSISQEPKDVKTTLTDIKNEILQSEELNTNSKADSVPDDTKLRKDSIFLELSSDYDIEENDSEDSFTSAVDEEILAENINELTNLKESEASEDVVAKISPECDTIQCNIEVMNETSDSTNNEAIVSEEITIKFQKTDEPNEESNPPELSPDFKDLTVSIVDVRLEKNSNNDEKLTLDQPMKSEVYVVPKSVDSQKSNIHTMDDQVPAKSENIEKSSNIEELKTGDTIESILDSKDTQVQTEEIQNQEMNVAEAMPLDIIADESQTQILTENAESISKTVLITQNEAHSNATDLLVENSKSQDMVSSDGKFGSVDPKLDIDAKDVLKPVDVNQIKAIAETEEVFEAVTAEETIDEAKPQNSSMSSENILEVFKAVQMQVETVTEEKNTPILLSDCKVASVLPEEEQTINEEKKDNKVTQESNTPIILSDCNALVLPEEEQTSIEENRDNIIVPNKEEESVSKEEILLTLEEVHEEVTENLQTQIDSVQKNILKESTLAQDPTVRVNDNSKSSKVEEVPNKTITDSSLEKINEKNEMEILEKPHIQKSMEGISVTETVIKSQESILDSNFTPEVGEEVQAENTSIVNLVLATDVLVEPSKSSKKFISTVQSESQRMSSEEAPMDSKEISQIETPPAKSNIISAETSLVKSTVTIQNINEAQTSSKAISATEIPEPKKVDKNDEKIPKTNSAGVATTEDKLSEVITEQIYEVAEMPPIEVLTATCKIITHPPLQPTESLIESAQYIYEKISYPAQENTRDISAPNLAEELRMAADRNDNKDSSKAERVIPQSIACESRCFTLDPQPDQPIASVSVAIEQEQPNAQDAAQGKHISQVVKQYLFAEQSARKTKAKNSCSNKFRSLTLRDRRFLAELEKRRKQRELIQNYLDSLDSIDTPSYLNEDLYLFESKCSIERSPYSLFIEPSDYSIVDVTSTSPTAKMHFLKTNILFSDRISSDSNCTDDSTTTVIDTFGSMESQSNSDSGEEFSPDGSTDRDSSASAITANNSIITTNKATNQSHIYSPPQPQPELRTESACSKLLETRTTVGNEEHVDDDPLKHLVPGSIAEREYKKWYNAVDMPNNPYSVEALRRRLSGGPDRTLDLPNISPCNEENPIQLCESQATEVDNKGQERDYSRYTRDYYINDAKQASGTTKKSPTSPPQVSSPTSTASSIELGERVETYSKTVETTSTREMCHKLEKQSRVEADIYLATPVHVIEDIPQAFAEKNHIQASVGTITSLTSEAVSKLSSETSSTLTNESLTPSEDSDTIRIYDLKKQETRLIKESTQTTTITMAKSPEKKVRPTELDIVPTLAPPIATVSSKCSTPTSFKFLQPKRKLINPSQVLSIDQDTTPISTSTPEKPVIEAEVAHVMPSVKALAKAFLMTSSSSSSENKWRKARVKSPLQFFKPTTPSAATSAAHISKVIQKQPETALADTTSQGSEDATIASDLSSLETDPPSRMDGEMVDSNASEDRPLSPVVLSGCLRNNIAFFENLKNN